MRDSGWWRSEEQPEPASTARLLSPESEGEGGEREEGRRERRALEPLPRCHIRSQSEAGSEGTRPGQHVREREREGPVRTFNMNYLIIMSRLLDNMLPGGSHLVSPVKIGKLK